MATGPVTYDYATWIAAYPEFSGCSSTQGETFFDMATFICPNTSANKFGEKTSQMLYLLTSHIAWLFAPRDAFGKPAATGSPAPPVVGRISSASEGSVSVSSEWSAGSPSPSQAWFLQSQYGALYWQASAGFRNMRYMARPTIVANGAFPFRR